VAALLALGCSDGTTPAETALAAHPVNIHAVSQSADKGYIDGWFDGQEVQLYYTKAYFCAEPPVSQAPSDCEIGAPAEVGPRPGVIPTIYAIAAVGFQPEPSPRCASFREGIQPWVFLA